MTPCKKNLVIQPIQIFVRDCERSVSTMSLKNIFKPALLLVLVLALAAGCAKKPTEDATANVDQTEIAQEQVAAVSEQPVTEEPVVSQPVHDMNNMNHEDMAAKLVRVHFDFDQYVLTPEARMALAGNAEYLKSRGSRVQIEGHCDERGSDEYNLALGEKRALAVKNYLVSLGVMADRMTVISYGEEIPLVMGNTEDAWAQNRRAEFKELN